MSMLVQVSEVDRMHNGRLVKAGELVKLPNSMALAMLKKNRATKPTDAQYKEFAETRSLNKAAAAERREESDRKGNRKGKR